MVVHLKVFVIRLIELSCEVVKVNKKATSVLYETNCFESLCFQMLIVNQILANCA